MGEKWQSDEAVWEDEDLEAEKDGGKGRRVGRRVDQPRRKEPDRQTDRH
jgi:hypothetical protein